MTEGYIRRAEAAYFDDKWPERACDYCGRPYRGPAVYCSLSHALADSGRRCGGQCHGPAEHRCLACPVTAQGG